MNNNTKLPKGAITNEWESFYPSADGSGYEVTDLRQDYKPAVCTCGSWVTYGKDCPLEFHSIDVCDLFSKKKDDNTDGNNEMV